MNFCFDLEWLESLVDLAFISNISRYGELTDEQLRKYDVLSSKTFLDKEAAGSKDVITIFMLDKIMKDKFLYENV